MSQSTATAAMPSFPIMSLPSEVRLFIYQAYFELPGGYVQASDPERLVGANGERIDLSLMFTCRLIAQETRGLPFLSNTLTFSTIYSNHATLAARRYKNLLGNLKDAESEYLIRGCIGLDEDIYTKMLSECPIYFKSPDGSCIDEVRNGFTRRDWSYCGTRSMHEQATTSALQHLLSIHKLKPIEILNTLKVRGTTISDELSFREFSQIPNICRDPWAIPSWRQLNDMAKLFPQDDIHKWEEFSNNNDTRKHRFSAAAAATLFLGSLPPEGLQQLRQIILNEDHMSVPSPESHAQGLIPFCKKNPNLCIERRVNIWRTIFGIRGSTTTNGTNEFASRWRNSASFCKSTMCTMFKWFDEALGLELAGMPPNSMSLFLDADPAPELCSQIFDQVFHRDIAWALSGYRTHPEAILSFREPLIGFGLGEDEGRILMLGMRQLINKNSALRCNFNLGELWDVEQISKETSHWSVDQWLSEWNHHLNLSSEVSTQLVELTIRIGEKSHTETEIRNIVEYAEKGGLTEQRLE